MANFKYPELADCIAYHEYKRTKRLSAFTLNNVKSRKKINQYYTKTVFDDDSYCLVSSCKNKIDLNTMIVFSKMKEGIAVRILF